MTGAKKRPRKKMNLGAVSTKGNISVMGENRTYILGSPEGINLYAKF